MEPKNWSAMTSEKQSEILLKLKQIWSSNGELKWLSCLRHHWTLTNDLINNEQHLQESLMLKTKAPFCDRGVVKSVAL